MVLFLLFIVIIITVVLIQLQLIANRWPNANLLADCIKKMLGEDH
jgi:hypothetical protein